MPSSRELINEYQAKRKKIEQMGGPKAIEERHKEGKLSARERIDYLLDPGTFTEIGLFVKNRTTHFGMDKKEINIVFLQPYFTNS